MANYPFVRANRLSHLAMAIVVAVGSAGLLAGMKHTGRAVAAAVASAQPRVVFVSYVDDPSDVRLYRDFQAFGDAVRRLDPELANRIDLEFVQASVDRGESIDVVMRRVVASRPAVIVASSDDVLDAARATTADVPVVFASHADPVAAGYVKSIAVPGVPRTGFTFCLPLTQKMLEILASAYPNVRRVGIIADHLRADASGFVADVNAAREALGLDVSVFVATTATDVERVLQTASAAGIDAWYVPVGEALWNDEGRVLDLMEGSQKPVLYERTRLARRAGALAYEPRVSDPIVILATQSILVLRGADPATIPVERPSEFELSINVADAAWIVAARPSKPLVKRANKLFLSDAASP